MRVVFGGGKCIWCAIADSNKPKRTVKGNLVYDPLIDGGAPWYARWFGTLCAVTAMCVEYDEAAIAYKKHHLIKQYVLLGKEYLHEVY